MGLLMNAVNSAVKRKARASSEGATEESRSRQTLMLQAYQSENNEEKTTADVENTDSEPTGIAIRDLAFEEENKEQEKEGTADASASAESQPLIVQQSKLESENESDTSSKRAVKERKGLLKINLLRKKVEAERSSNTPDSERSIQGSSETSSKKWRSWGRKSGTKNLREEADKNKDDDQN